MAKWYVAAKKADFNGIGQRFSISPVLARVIRNRDIEGEEAIEKYLHGTIRDLYDPAFLKGSCEAVLLLKDKIKGQMPIRVIGDYDADGICSSYILKRGLEACGAVVDTMIPHRMKDGYGLNEHLVDEAYADGIDTILTCDNGIAAYAQIEQAKKYGMTVIVTDHHEIPYEEELLAEPDPETGETSRRRYKIPPADVVIDPKQPGDTYPFQEICGAVVAFKLMQLLFAEFGFDGISTDLTSGKRSLLDELLGAPIQKEEHASPNPAAAKTEKSRPSAPTSEKQSRTAEGTAKSPEERPSVREELREIRESRQKEAAEPGISEPTPAKEPKKQQTTTHKQPSRKKPKKAKER